MVPAHRKMGRLFALAFLSYATTLSAIELSTGDFNHIAEKYLENPSIITPALPETTPTEKGKDEEKKIISSFFSSGKQNDQLPLEAFPKDPLVEPEPLICEEGYTVNFEDVSVMQLLRFISQISNTNFIFNNQDLNFNITIVSEEPTTAEDLNAALLQILRMHGLSVVQQGNNVLIYRDEELLSRVAVVVTDQNAKDIPFVPIMTRVFKLYNLSAEGVANIIKPLLSKEAIVEISAESQHVIVSDISSNVQKIGELIEALDIPNIVIEVGQYQVQNSSPRVLETYANQILAPLVHGGTPFQLIAQPSSGIIFIVSTPFFINKAIEILTALDNQATPLSEEVEKADLESDAMANNNFYLYKLQYHDGREIAQSLRDIGANLQRAGLANMDLVSTINSLQWIQANNSLVFSGTDDAIQKLQGLLAELDVAPKQVFIEVLIIDTTIRNSLNFGVEWVALGREQNKLAFAGGLLNAPPPDAPFGDLGFQQPPLFGGARDAFNNPPPNPARNGQPGTGGDVPLSAGFGLGIVGNIIRHNGESFLTLGALVSALEVESETTIVLNPRIMTEDNKEANIFVGQNIPYQTTSTVIRDTGSVTQNLQYEDIGVQLRVTPFIGANDMVTLQIDQSVSELVSGNATISTVGGETVLLAPTTNKTLASTRVHVPNGSFLVMSGHIRDFSVFERSGIPCLGTLPLIGPTFSNTSEAREKRNLIMFIRPHVVTTPQDGVQLSNEEGYEFNYGSNPCFIKECRPERAPEAQTYPPPNPNPLFAPCLPLPEPPPPPCPTPPPFPSCPNPPPYPTLPPCPCPAVNPPAIP